MTKTQLRDLITSCGFEYIREDEENYQYRKPDKALVAKLRDLDVDEVEENDVVLIHYFADGNYLGDKWMHPIFFTDEQIMTFLNSEII